MGTASSRTQFQAEQLTNHAAAEANGGLVSEGVMESLTIITQKQEHEARTKDERWNWRQKIGCNGAVTTVITQ